MGPSAVRIAGLAERLTALGCKVVDKGDIDAPIPESKTEGDQYTRVERAHGLFYRRFALPDSANPEGITAAGKHGVLEIAIPKRAETKARRIEING